MLFEIINQRVNETREFIELPWEKKKKRLRELWAKYGRLYLLLFVAAAIVAFINVYWTWLQSQPYKFKQIGGENTGTVASISNTPPSPPETVEAAPTVEKKEEPAKNINPAKEEPKEEKPSGNNKSKSEFDKLVAKTAPPADIGKNNDLNNKQGNSLKPGEGIINGKKVTNMDKELKAINQKSQKNKLKQEIAQRKEARKAKQPKQSIGDSLKGMSGNLTAAIDGGMGKALSVIGAFFMFLIGMVLFCFAPVALFYMWMRKLIMPMFPTKMAPAPGAAPTGSPASPPK